MSKTNINEINNYNSPNQQGNNNQQFNLTINTGEKVQFPKFLTATLPEGTDLIGRDDDLATLGSLLESKERVVLVNGIGGVGKTELCKRFFRSHFDSSNFKHFAWINYYSSLKESFALQFELPGISDRQDISMDDRFKAIISCLRSLGRECLLVVDNMDSIKDDDLKELKQLTNKVIVTSRIRLNGLEPYHLGLLPLEQCIELFYNHYNGSRDDEHLIKIIELAGRHTLTVELLAKTAESSATELEKFYSQLIEVGFNLNDVIQEKVSTEYNEHNDDTFFNHLLKVFELSGITEQEIYILTNLSILPAMYIEMNSIKEWLVLDTKNELNSLIKKGWLEQKGFSTYMHPVIGDVIRSRTEPDLEKCLLLVKSMTVSLSYESNENPLSRKEFIPYSESILEYLKDDKYELIILSKFLGEIYIYLGRFEKALVIFWKAITFEKKIFNEEYLGITDSLSNIGVIYVGMGRFVKALEVQQEAHNVREKVLNRDDPILAKSYVQLGVIYGSMGNLTESLKLQLKAIAIQEKVEGMNRELALSYCNLSRIYKELGEYENALDIQLKAISIQNKFLEKNHYDFPTSFDNLATIYKMLGKYEDACHFYLKAISIQEQILENEHPNLAAFYNNLSLTYHYMGKQEKALCFQLKSIDYRKKDYYKDHPSLAASYDNLGMIYYALNKLEEALKYHLKALNILKTVFNKEHHNFGSTYNNLACTFAAMGKVNKAINYQLKAINIEEKTLGMKHPELSKSYLNMSNIYSMLGDHKKTMIYLRKGLDIAPKSSLDNDPILKGLNDFFRTSNMPQENRIPKNTQRNRNKRNRKKKK